jgi:hypothetical protein
VNIVHRRRGPPKLAIQKSCNLGTQLQFLSLSGTKMVEWWQAGVGQENTRLRWSC